jgi:hypothetical protein
MSEPNAEVQTSQSVATPKRASTKRASTKKSTPKRGTVKRGTATKSTTARKSSTRERKTQPLSAALIKRVKSLSKNGKTLQEIADALNKSKETTARGLPWTTQNVWHVLRRK